MDAKFTYVYLPVADLAVARTFYRDVLGFEESWREGDLTCAFQLPGSPIQLMLNQIENPGDPNEVAGIVLTLPEIDEWYQAQSGIEFTSEPMDIPGGRWLRAKDVSGNGLYFANVE